MAEINSSAAPAAKAGGRRGKKMSTKVDLTPMVDLGFLLITFFVFTTTMSEPTAMQLNMPADGGPDMPVKESGSLTIIPVSNNRIFYYHGMIQVALRNPAAYGYASYSYADGIGQVIRDKKKALSNMATVTEKDLMIIVKPMDTASYQNVVDVLDEMKINNVKSYALGDLHKDELALLTAKGIR
jgi:biopolymer transport protein ExbD